MIHQLAQLTGIDLDVCRQAVERVAARYHVITTDGTPFTLLTLEDTAAGILDEIEAGHERYMIVRYFHEEVLWIVEHRVY